MCAYMRIYMLLEIFIVPLQLRYLATTNERLVRSQTSREKNCLTRRGKSNDSSQFLLLIISYPPFHARLLPPNNDLLVSTVSRVVYRQTAVFINVSSRIRSICADRLVESISNVQRERESSVPGPPPPLSSSFIHA